MSVEGNQFFFLDKFMLGTAFSLTLGLLCVSLALLLFARAREWQRTFAFFYAVSLAGMLCLLATLALLSPGVRAVRADDPVAEPISTAEAHLPGEAGS